MIPIAIPQVPKGLDKQTQIFFSRVKEALEILLGTRSGVNTIVITSKNISSAQFEQLKTLLESF